MVIVEPLVQTPSVEEMLARKLAHLLVRFKSTQAHATLHRRAAAAATGGAAASLRPVSAQGIVPRDRHSSLPRTAETRREIFVFLRAAAGGVKTGGTHDLEDRSDCVLDPRDGCDGVHHQHRQNSFGWARETG